MSPEKQGKSMNLERLLARFSEIEGVLVADRDGIQLASAFAEGGSIFQKKQISTMIIDSLFQNAGAIEMGSHDSLQNVTLQLPRHLVQLTRLGSMAIILVLRGSRNEGLANLISQDLKELYKPLSIEAGKLG